ncbi:hypothetical protein H5410_015413 [Solanum commersonii]|uniref:At2g35280-like TPR domain-containing protein n=1 Tax=Solanum commersonii TaxID=4109 RepID=A0A9J5ZTF7_SOLCO|nr:hypothetical protein H5410_015413 [Solanum commersonii]
MEHAKSSVRGTYEHMYVVLNAYLSMLEVANPRSKMTLSLDENERFKYNTMTSNIAKSVNAMFDVERKFPVVALFDEINRRFALLFHQRRIELEIHPVPLEDSWIVPLDIIEREISPPYVDPSKSGRRRYKRCRGKKKSSKMTRSKKNYIESLLIELLIDIVERIASYSLKDLMNVRLRVLNQVANEPSVYQKLSLVNFPYRRWLIVQEAISFLEMYRVSGNLEVLYRKGVFDFFNHNDPNALGMINQATGGGHIGTSYVLAIISIFKGGESMREGLMFIANMKKVEPLKVRRCRQHLRNILGGMWVPEPHLLGERPICCIVHQPEQIARKNGWPRGSIDEDDICRELCSCDLELDYVVKFLPHTTVKKKSSKVTRSKKNYIESLQRQLLIDILERISSYSFKDLMNVRLRVLNQVASEPSVYQKVTLVDFTEYIWPCNPWSVIRKCTSFLEMCRASGNFEALYRKGVVDYFHHSNPNALEMLNQAADRGDIGASYALAIISIFKGGESMREGLMFIANMKKMKSLKIRRCRHKLRYILFGRVSEPHLLGERPICYTVHQFYHVRCELCSCDLERDEENVCNFFRWRDREDVDIRSKFIILRFVNRIKELEIDDENDPCVATYETYIATNDLYVATDSLNVATYHLYVATFDHVRHMLLQMTHKLLQITLM